MVQTYCMYWLDSQRYCITGVLVDCAYALVYDIVNTPCCIAASNYYAIRVTTESLDNEISKKPE